MHPKNSARIFIERVGMFCRARIGITDAILHRGRAPVAFMHQSDHRHDGTCSRTEGDHEQRRGAPGDQQNEADQRDAEVMR